MSDVLQFLSALDSSAKTTTGDLQAVVTAAANAASATAGITGGAGASGSGLGGVGGADRSGEGQAGISGGLVPKIKSTTVSGGNAGGFPDLISALKQLGGRT